LVSVLAMVWLYIDTKDAEKVSDLATSVFWLVLPSLGFFIAENLAIYLHTVVAVDQMKDTNITINKVEVWETENAFATAS